MNVRKVLQIPGGVRKAQKSVILPKNLEPKQTFLRLLYIIHKSTVFENPSESKGVDSQTKRLRVRVLKSVQLGVRPKTFN